MRKLYLALLLNILWAGTALAETIDGITYALDAATSTATVTNTPYGSVVIPATVKYNNRTYNVTAISGVDSGITSCEIPEGVISIGFAFERKSSLISVSIPSTVQQIAYQAFYNCTSLISVNISEGVQRIEDYAFYNCTSLISVNIPEGVTYIGNKAFSGCSKLPNITIPTTISSMGNNSFVGCTNLKTIIWNAKKCVDFASGTVSPFNYYSNGWFMGNNYTTTITFGEEVEYIPAYLCYEFYSLSTVIIPNSVREIGKYAFYQDSYSTTATLTSVIFGTGLERIGSYSFCNRVGLTSVTIPDNSTTIESYAFANCSNISLITLGKNITTIGSSAFADCPNINTINIYATTPPVITKDVFSGISDLMAVTLNARTKAVDTYKAAAVWKDMYVQAMENDIRTFTLNVSPADEKRGTTTPGGDFDEDSEILIYAAAKEGYKFCKWNDGNTENPRIVKMIGDLSYTAQFEAAPPVYSITTKANAVEGTAIGGGAYEAGEQVTLAAVGNTGYHFVQWADGNSANPRQITVTTNGSYVAQFAKDAAKYTLTTSSTNMSQGTAYGQGKYDESTNIAIFAVANNGYHFTQWHDGNTENPRMVTINSDAMYFANFAQDPTLYELKLKPENASQGWTTEGGAFEMGTQVMVYAHPASGFVFSQWNDGSKENPRFLNITGSVNLTAHFKNDPMTGVKSVEAKKTTTSPRKVARNGQVFIEYEDKTYTMQGIEVK